MDNNNTMAAELERLRQENAALKAAKETRGVVSFRISEKGACSVYGLGRFPVTLYKEQWDRLLSKVEDLRAFLKAHESEFSVKE